MPTTPMSDAEKDAILRDSTRAALETIALFEPERCLCTEYGEGPLVCPVHRTAQPGTPALPDSRTLAECLGDLDAILARVSVFRSAVQRLPGDRELTTVRLDNLAADLRDAIETGDRAMASWRAGS